MRASILSFLVITMAAAAEAQQSTVEQFRQQLEWYKSRAEPILSEVRDELRSTLSAEQRATEATISYRILLDGNCNAFARRVDGRRTIETTAGFVQIIDWVSTALAIGDRFGAPDCLAEYMDYLTDGILDNSDRIAAHERLQPVASTLKFVHDNRDVCPRVTEASFRAKPGADDMRERLLRGGIKFLAAHELAHHLLGHVGRMPGNVEAIREQERRADEFAFSRMILSSTSPIEAMSVLLLYGTLEGFSIEGEDTSTHPAGVRRFATMIEAAERLISSDAAAVAAMRRDGKYDEFVTGVRQMRQRLVEMETQHK
jgi:hypothetical protein